MTPSGIEPATFRLVSENLVRRQISDFCVPFRVSVAKYCVLTDFWVIVLHENVVSDQPQVMVN